MQVVTKEELESLFGGRSIIHVATQLGVSQDAVFKWKRLGKIPLEYAERLRHVQTVAQVYKACPKEFRITIGEFYAVPMRWRSPTNGQVSGLFFVANLGSGVFAELTLTGKLVTAFPGVCDHYEPAWAETKEEHLEALKGMVNQLTKEV